MTDATPSGVTPWKELVVDRGLAVALTIVLGIATFAVEACSGIDDRPPMTDLGYAPVVGGFSGGGSGSGGATVPSGGNAGGGDGTTTNTSGTTSTGSTTGSNINGAAGNADNSTTSNNSGNVNGAAQNTGADQPGSTGNVPTATGTGISDTTTTSVPCATCPASNP